MKITIKKTIKHVVTTTCVIATANAIAMGKEKTDFPAFAPQPVFTSAACDKAALYTDIRLRALSDFKLAWREADAKYTAIPLR